MRQAVIAMMVYTALFGALALVSIHGYFHSYAPFDIGLPARTTDLIILTLSLAGLIKSLWHILMIET